jgi:hypothetical protein
MALTEAQDIPQKPKPSEPWMFKKLLNLAGVSSFLAKSSFNIFDILLGYLVFVVGISELFGRRTSWSLLVLVVIMLTADIYIWLQTQKRQTQKQSKK